MNIKNIVLFCLLMLPIFVILACDSGSGRGGSHTVITTKTTLADIIDGCIVDSDNNTIINSSGNVVAYITGRGYITDADNNILGSYDSSTGEIKDTDGEVVCYVDDGNISVASAYNYRYSEEVHSIDNAQTISNNNVVSSVESFSDIELGDEINISSGIVSLEDYYNGVSLDSELNYNFLRPVGADDYYTLASQVSVKTNETTNFNQVLGMAYYNSTSYPTRSFSTKDELTKYTYFIGNLDTNKELQKLTAYVDTTNDMFSSLEIMVEDDDVEKILVDYKNNGSTVSNLYEGWNEAECSRRVNPKYMDNLSDYCDNNSTLKEYITTNGGIVDFDYTYLSDSYNQTLIYDIDPDKGDDATTGNLFSAVTYRDPDGDGTSKYFLNIGLAHNSPIITSDDVIAQKYSHFSIGLGKQSSHDDWANYIDQSTAHRAIIYMVEKALLGDYNNDYAIITLGNANVGLVVTSNNDISIDTDPYSGIGYFRKSGSYFMEMEVIGKDNSTIVDDESNIIENDNGTITLSSTTRDMVDNNSIVVDNETVIVSLINGKIIQGNYLLFAGQYLFNDTSNVNVGDKFVIRFDKGAVVFRKDIATSLYDGSTSSVSATSSGADGIYHTLYATYDGKQSPAIHQITSNSYDNFTTTFSSINGDTATFYIPQIEDYKNITYVEVKVKLKAGLDTSNIQSDTISFNYGTVTGETTLAKLNLLEDYWADNSGSISITINGSLTYFTSTNSINDVISIINSQLGSDGVLSYNEDTSIFTLRILKGSSVIISGDLADLLGIAYSNSD